MTWIKTIPLSEADDELRKAMEGQNALYPKEYSVPVHPTEGGGAQIVGLALPDSAGALSRVRDLWLVDVARPSARAPASRDDRHHGLGDQPVRVLNRVTRRVSASRDLG